MKFVYDTTPAFDCNNIFEPLVGLLLLWIVWGRSWQQTFRILVCPSVAAPAHTTQHVFPIRPIMPIALRLSLADHTETTEHLSENGYRLCIYMQIMLSRSREGGAGREEQGERSREGGAGREVHQLQNNILCSLCVCVFNV